MCFGLFVTMHERNRQLKDQTLSNFLFRGGKCEVGNCLQKTQSNREDVEKDMMTAHS